MTLVPSRRPRSVLELEIPFVPSHLQRHEIDRLHAKIAERDRELFMLRQRCGLDTTTSTFDSAGREGSIGAGKGDYDLSMMPPPTKARGLVPLSSGAQEVTALMNKRGKRSM